MPKYRKCFVSKPCGCTQHWHGTKVWTDRCPTHSTAALPFGGIDEKSQPINDEAGSCRLGLPNAGSAIAYHAKG